jgi:hypothetical protein
MARELSLAELANLAAEQEDQTEVVTGGEYEREIVPEGINFARLIEYIELGKRPQKPYQGKDKPPAEEVRLTFELLHPKKLIEYEHEGEKHVRGHLISVRIKKSLSDKAQFKKLFNAMAYGRSNIKHIAQMLNEVFKVHVVHYKKTVDGKEQVYANLRDDTGWKISAPFHEDPISGERTDLRPMTREATQPLRIFLWNNPTKATWDSLFIDGTRTIKDKEGNESEVSKNWLQGMIMEALNFPGSPLDIMLGGLDDLPGAVADKAPAEQASTATEKPAEKQEAAPVKQTTASDANDALAALGLVG